MVMNYTEMHCDNGDPESDMLLAEALKIRSFLWMKDELQAAFGVVVAQKAPEYLYLPVFFR